MAIARPPVTICTHSSLLQQLFGQPTKIQNYFTTGFCVWSVGQSYVLCTEVGVKPGPYEDRQMNIKTHDNNMLQQWFLQPKANNQANTFASHATDTKLFWEGGGGNFQIHGNIMVISGLRSYMISHYIKICLLASILGINRRNSVILWRTWLAAQDMTRWELTYS